MAGFYDGKHVSESPSESEVEAEEEEEAPDEGVSSDTDDEAEKRETLQMKVMRIAKGMTVSDLLTPRSKVGCAWRVWDAHTAGRRVRMSWLAGWHVCACSVCFRRRVSGYRWAQLWPMIGE